MPTNSLQGIDVSHYQGSVNWSSVKNAGTVFAFAKATDGNTYTDPQFRTNWQAMQAAGILRGAYHFYETNDDPVTQAQNFINAIGSLAANDLPPVVDIEIFKGNFGSASVAANLQTWMDTVEKALSRKPMIYTNTNFWNETINADFSKYPLWIAEYGVSQPKIPSSWKNWNFWQSSQSGSVAGVTGSVDTDVFAGSMSDLLGLIKAG
jgi:lysozyme